MNTNSFIVEVTNTYPDEDYAGKFIVARLVDGVLWFYGSYETEEKANAVREEFENGIVLKG